MVNQGIDHKSLRWVYINLKFISFIEVMSASVTRVSDNPFWPTMSFANSVFTNGMSSNTLICVRRLCHMGPSLWRYRNISLPSTIDEYIKFIIFRQDVLKDIIDVCFIIRVRNNVTNIREAFHGVDQVSLRAVTITLLPIEAKSFANSCPIQWLPPMIRIALSGSSIFASLILSNQAFVTSSSRYC
jgi:hypothetical protein